MRAFVRKLGVGLGLALVILGVSAGMSGAAGGTAVPPAIHVAPQAGPPGLTFTLTGEHLTKGTTYNVLLCPKGDLGDVPCGYVGSYLGPLRQFTADASAQVPAGTTGVIPDVVAGSYAIEAFSGNAVVAFASFEVTAPTLSIAPASGAAGLSVTLSGQGFGPGASYTVCMLQPTDAACGYTGIAIGEFTVDASGSVPAGAHVAIPGSAPGGYKLGVFLKDGTPTIIASGQFTVTAPSLTLASAAAPGGSQIGATGSGYAPGREYLLCLVPAGATQCGGIGTYVARFTADSSGAMPAGTSAAIPTSAPGQYAIGILIPNSTATLLVSTPFRLLAGTPAPPTAATATPAPTSAPTVTVAPSAAPDGTSSADSGGSLLPLLLLIVLLVIAGVVFVLWRRRQQEAKKLA